MKIEANKREMALTQSKIYSHPTVSQEKHIPLCQPHITMVITMTSYPFRQIPEGHPAVFSLIFCLFYLCFETSTQMLTLAMCMAA